MGTQRIADRQVDLSDLADGDLTTVSGNLNSLKHNRNALSAPTANDDASAGYAVGSVWIYGSIVYIATAVTVAAAAWQQIVPSQGGVPSGGSDGQVLTKVSGNPAWATPPDYPVLRASAADLYGDGSDGAKTYSANTTLTSDVNATTITVNSGVTVKIGWNSSAGRPVRLRATTSITVNGTISADGEDGQSGVSGVNGKGGKGGNSLTGGGGGGGGRNGSAAVGSGGSSQRPSWGGANGSASNGGKGGGDRGGAGGTSSVAGASADTYNLIKKISTLSDLYTFPLGSGGGGGAADPTAGNQVSGAGGGGGGGGIYLFAPAILGTGTITAKGGNYAGSSFSTYHSGSGTGGVIVLCAGVLDNLSLDISNGTSVALFSLPTASGAIVIISPSYIHTNFQTVYIPLVIE